ncbi:cupin domain-containing protein [Phycicoccus sp. MAQZ13P-2]|uniref:cupin domain-containing protein n=1 Tax=Phycicoccus mangrovi TaxID=2840470 RepID=UPI001C007BE8|nr:cupin domain-containing protein [Phycicoccus mangrovi]MBT9256453.1 cupin domain-containing protein [Phycicoccus mangrovi]MBT9275102.1 cupin domain-containing protein [Phycicoccus mangrovi]
MSFHERPGSEGVVVLPEAEQMSRPGVGRAVALGAQTAGDFGLFRGEMPSGSEVAAHLHQTFSESFYVLSGRLELWDGGSWRGLAAGDLAYVPRGGVHGLRVPEGPAEVLTLFVPGVAREQFVLELLEIRQSGRTLTAQEWTEFYARHDQYMV